MNARAPFIRAPKRLETKADFAVFISDMADSATVFGDSSVHVSEHLHLGSLLPVRAFFFLRRSYDRTNMRCRLNNLTEFSWFLADRVLGFSEKSYEHN